jgi:DeoR/GlpR family transcriptional regulator of sugar metabolism
MYKASIVTIGAEATRFFSNIHADICLMGVCSIHLALGLTNDSYEEAEVKKAMIAQSKKVVALTTLEKIDTAEAFSICSASALHMIVTPEPGEEKLDAFRAAGITVI